MKKVFKNKRNLTIIIIIVSIILSNFITLAIYKNYNKKIDIQLSNQIWNTYDKSIENIKNNMDPITEPNENYFWWTLKDFDITDDEYEKILNRLVADVRMCYLEYNQSMEYFTNPILEYRDKEYISSKQLNRLNLDMNNEFNNGCLKRFESYNSLLISHDESLRKKVLNKVNKFNKNFAEKPTVIFVNKDATYDELLLRKIIEVHYIEDISEFLVEEYNRLK